MQWTKLRPVAGTLFISLLTLALLCFCFRNIHLSQLLQSFLQLRFPYFLLALGFSFLVLVLLTLQFQSFLTPRNSIASSRLFALVAVFAMTTNLLPFGGAYPLFIYLFGKREKLGAAAALSLLTLDQIMDGLGKLCLFALLLMGVTLPLWIYRGIQAFVGALLIVYILVFIFAFVLKEKKDFATAPKILRRLFSFVNDWAHHLHTLRSLSKTLWAIFLGIAMKLCEVASVWAIQESFGVSLGWPAALLLVSSLCITTALPSTPAKLGIYEGTALVVYEYLGLDPSLALTLGIFIHLAHSLPLVLAGYFSALRMRIQRKEIFQELPAQELG